MNGKEVQKGFNRSEFKQTAEHIFDEQFSYQRDLKETYEYNRVLKKGTKDERMLMREKTYGLSVNP